MSNFKNSTFFWNCILITFIFFFSIFFIYSFNIYAETDFFMFKGISEFVFDPNEYFDDSIDDNINNEDYVMNSDSDDKYVEEIYNSIQNDETSKDVLKKMVYSNSSIISFGAVGDFDCTHQTSKTVENILDIAPDIIFALGDLSYGKTSNCWFQITDDILDKMQVAIGNHDIDSQKKLKDYMEFFNLEKQYYSFNYGNIHFLALSTEVPYSKSSKQYEFVKTDLEKTSSDASIDWIIVYFHRHMYGSGSTPDEEKDFRKLYHPLFDKHDVDLALQAHQHIYERMFPLKYNHDDSDEPIITTYDNYNYIDPEGVIFITIGTGGAKKTGFSDIEDFTAERFFNYGLLYFYLNEFDNTIIGTFLGNNGQIYDNFKITK